MSAIINEDVHSIGMVCDNFPKVNTQICRRTMVFQMTLHGETDRRLIPSKRHFYVLSFTYVQYYLSMLVFAI